MPEWRNKTRVSRDRPSDASHTTSAPTATCHLPWGEEVRGGGCRSAPVQLSMPTRHPPTPIEPKAKNVEASPRQGAITHNMPTRRRQQRKHAYDRELSLWMPTRH